MSFDMCHIPASYECFRGYFLSGRFCLKLAYIPISISTNDSELIFKLPVLRVRLTLGSDLFRILNMQTSTATGECGFSQFQIGAEKIRKQKKKHLFRAALF